MFDSPDPRVSDSRDREASDPRDAHALDPRDVFTRDLDLPRGLERERVHVHEHRQDYRLRGSEVRALATIGAFRVVAADDLRDDHGRPGDVRHGDLERLRSAGLIRAVAPLDRGDRTVIVTLTERGREVLDTHRSRGAATRQTFYAGAVKSRELSHAQLYRPCLRAADRLRAQGARIERVVLDDELKREYQKFLQQRKRDRSDSDVLPDRSREEIHQWPIEHDLLVVNEHVQFPDFRIEYERARMGDAMWTTSRCDPPLPWHARVRESGSRPHAIPRVHRAGRRLERGGDERAVRSAHGRGALAMTWDERVAYVRLHRYTDRQAAFLVTVMLH